MSKGSLVYEDYKNLIKNNNIIYKQYAVSQIQPSSFDLTLSKECYEIEASFLSANSPIRKKLKNIIKKKINLENSYVFKRNITYLVRLNEKLKLPKNIFGKCNPKSSTGRLDIFCRTILDNCDEYEKIPSNYSGEIFLEITSRSFDIQFNQGDSLNQMRLIYNRHLYMQDSKLSNFHIQKPIVFNKMGKRCNADILNGLKISVDLNHKNKISSYVAKEKAPMLIFNKIMKYNISNYWDKINTKKNFLLIKPKKFYILKSKEKIRIPKELAGEMIPYDTGIGDFRVHYAGFFDPGFGEPFGSFAVLELKTNEVPFILQDGQVIARIKYEKLNKKSKVVYGSSIKSNYQNQGLALGKHFKT